MIGLDLSPYRLPRRSSKAEEARFKKAFLDMLADNPDAPPGPAGLARAMGLGNTRNLNGRLSHLRRRLLREHGFYKDDRDGRWRKVGRP